jgi:hypothetical protein
MGSPMELILRKILVIWHLSSAQYFTNEPTFPTRCMLVSADDCGFVHLDVARHHASSIHRLQHCITDPGDGPAAELAVDGAPLAEILGQIPLG